jgi:hypothetical protein
MVTPAAAVLMATAQAVSTGPHRRVSACALLCMVVMMGVSRDVGACCSSGAPGSADGATGSSEFWPVGVRRVLHMHVIRGELMSSWARAWGHQFVLGGVSPAACMHLVVDLVGVLIQMMTMTCYTTSLSCFVTP